MSHIHTKHTSNSNGRSQIRATHGGKTVTHNYDHEFGSEQNHRLAAEKFAKEHSVNNHELHLTGEHTLSEDGTSHKWKLAD